MIGNHKEQPETLTATHQLASFQTTPERLGEHHQHFKHAKFSSLQQCSKFDVFPATFSCSFSPDMPTSPQVEASLECVWSEYTCSDSYSQTRWLKPEEYALYRKESQKQHQEH